MLQYYSVIIDRNIKAPGHVKEVVDDINTIDKSYIYQLMSNVKLLGLKTFVSQILINFSTQKNVFSLAK